MFYKLFMVQLLVSSSMALAMEGIHSKVDGDKGAQAVQNTDGLGSKEDRTYGSIKTIGDIIIEFNATYESILLKKPSKSSNEIYHEARKKLLVSCMMLKKTFDVAPEEGKSLLYKALLEAGLALNAYDFKETDRVFAAIRREMDSEFLKMMVDMMSGKIINEEAQAAFKAKYASALDRIHSLSHD